MSVNKKQITKKLKLNYEKILIAVGVSGILAYITSVYISLNKLDNMEYVIESINPNLINMLSTGKAVILLLSILILIIGLLLKIKSDFFSVIMTLFIVTSIFLFLGYITILREKTITNFFFLSSILWYFVIVWITFELLKGLNRWLRVKEKNKNDVDVVKLGLVWTVITFILNIMWIGK